MNPNKDWGGEGILGCNLSSGLLHMIDIPKNESIKYEKREIVHPEEKIDTRGVSVDFLIGLDKQNLVVEKKKKNFL